MSGTGDCASQEIEASTSSNSTRNSKKCHFVKAILKVEESQACSQDLRIILPSERAPGLPQLEKRDFVQNWLIAHGNCTNSPEKSYPRSPVLGISPTTRSPQSPILGYQWKCVKREASDEKSCRVSLSKKFQPTRPDSPLTERIKIEQENSQLSKSQECGFLNDDSDKTLIFSASPERIEVESSPVLNGITNTLAFDASRLSRRKTWLNNTVTLEKFDADSTLKCADRRSLVREGPKVPEALSLSSPLGARNKRRKIETSAADEPRSGIENLIKQSPRFFDVLAEDSPLDVETILLSSKTPETPSVSTIIDDYDGLAINPRGRIYCGADADIEKSERLRGGPFCFSPRTPNSYVKSEAAGILLNSRGSRKSRDSNRLPDTLSVSSSLVDDLVPDIANSANPSLQSSLAINATAAVKSVYSCGIKTKNSPEIFPHESVELPRTLSKRIDFDSNSQEDEVKIEVESDSEAATVSDFIENPATQNFAPVASKDESRAAKLADTDERFQKIDEESRDSDETYYSDGDSITRPQVREVLVPKNSQQISQTTSASANRSENRISQAASPVAKDNPDRPANATTVNATSNNKKKKKAKKGSLVARLQTMVSSQVSNLRIWRYQMSRPDFKNSNAQCVTLRIRERETRYGRHYLLASVIEDSYDLLKSLFDSSRRNNSAGIKILTLVLIPEIIGVVKIPANSALKIYPPWEIMDTAKKILNVTFFNVVGADEANATRTVATIREETRIVEDFDCPCLRAGKLVDPCPVKFTDAKPSVMQAIFGS